MATVAQLFGSQAVSGQASSLSTALSALGSKQVLIVVFEDLDDSLDNSTGATPNDGEDWLAGITYNLIDKLPAIASTARNVDASQGSPQIDDGFFRTGVKMKSYPVTVTFHVTDSSSNRPSATDL